jgi:hypothetical protein
MGWQKRKAYHFENGRISQLEASWCDKIDKTIHASDWIENSALRSLNEKSRIELVLPIMTLSELNGVTSKTRFIKTGKNKGKPAREHWREAWQRHKEQKRIVYLFLNPQISKVLLPCNVKLIRLGPRELDFDNLVASQKYVRDAVAEILTQNFVPGRADGDKRITWQYDQEKCSEYKVKIEISW